jgi:predicted permease
MSLFSEIRERVRALLFRRREERALEEELAFHLDMETEQNLRRGISPAESRRRAHLALGGTEVVREWVRDARGSRPLEDFVRDAALAVRTLGKRKEFTVVMLTVLALGIGANAATYSVVDALLLRKLPVTHPERLVAIGDPTRTNSLSTGSPRADIASYPLFVDVRDAIGVFEAVYATGRTGRLDVLVSEPGMRDAAAEAEHPAGRLVSGEFFDVLDVRAQLGRVFGREDDVFGSPSPVAVVSHGYWQSRLGGEDVLGRTISVNGVSLTVIGVTPEGFAGDIVGQPIDLWIPITMQPVLQPHTPFLEDRGANWLLMMGRLSEDATLEQARAEVTAIEARALRENASPGSEATIERLLREQPAPVEIGARGFSFHRAALGRPLLTVMAAVALVLLVACANVASLTMVRATARTREIGLRIALGAKRGRVIRQLLAESLVVAALGGALGLLVTRWGTLLLLRVASTERALPLDARLSPGVLAFTATLTIATALLFGIAPALRASRATAGLKSQGRGVAGEDGAKGRLPAGRTLVIAQVALSTVLLVGTGLLVRSVMRLQQADIGFDRDRTLVATIDAGRSGYEGERLAAFRRDLLTRLGAVPGVVAVSYSENGVFSGTESGTTLQVEGFTAASVEDTTVAYDDVGPAYFAAIGGRLLQGRDFGEGDDEAAPKVAVVNETMARFYFGDGSAIGRRITMGDASLEIVGVVADAEQQGLRDKPVRRLYLSMRQTNDVPGRFSVVALADRDPNALVNPIRSELRAIDPNLTILSVDPVSSLITASIAQDRMLMLVVTFFGGVTVALSGVGLFGLIAYGAARRRAEFGLRMALGARRGSVARMMLGEALVLVVLGLTLGVPTALLGTQLLRSQLFGIGLVDPTSLAAAAAVLIASAVLAAAVPALRAARVSPLESLRAE